MLHGLVVLYVAFATRDVSVHHSRSSRRGSLVMYRVGFGISDTEIRLARKRFTSPSSRQMTYERRLLRPAYRPIGKASVLSSCDQDYDFCIQSESGNHYGDICSAGRVKLGWPFKCLRYEWQYNEDLSTAKIYGGVELIARNANTKWYLAVMPYTVIPGGLVLNTFFWIMITCMLYRFIHVCYGRKMFNKNICAICGYPKAWNAGVCPECGEPY